MSYGIFRYQIKRKKLIFAIGVEGISDIGYLGQTLIFKNKK